MALKPANRHVSFNLDAHLKWACILTSLVLDNHTPCWHYNFAASCFAVDSEIPADCRQVLIPASMRSTTNLDKEDKITEALNFHEGNKNPSSSSYIRRFDWQTDGKLKSRKDHDNFWLAKSFSALNILIFLNYLITSPRISKQNKSVPK